MRPFVRHILVMSSLLLLSVCGCGKSEPAPTSSPAETKKPKTYVVGVSLTRVDEPWRAQMKADIEAAAAEHPNLQIVVKIADDDAAKQHAQLNEFYTDHVDAIIIRPVEAQALTAPVAQLIAAGIPVVVLDRALIGDKYTCFIGPDYKQIGAAAGKWLAGQLQGKGSIVEIKGPVNSLHDQELHTGFRSALLDPGYHFAHDAYVDPPRIDGAKVMREAMDDVETIDAVFAFDDAAAYAAYETAKAAERAKGVLFVGIGGVPAQGAAYVTDGALAASFLLPTGGAEAVETVVKLLHGEKVPKTVVPETQVITKGQ